MFKKLTDLSYQRNVTEAIGFYLAYSALGIIISVLLVVVLSLATQQDSYEFGLRVGNIVAVIFAPGISFLILKEKKLLHNFGFILIALSAGIIAFFIGLLGGLIPAAYLTTRPVNKN